MDEEPVMEETEEDQSLLSVDLEMSLQTFTSGM